MNANRLLLIIVLLCILPLLIMSANSGISIVDNLEPINKPTNIKTKIFSHNTEVNSALKVKVEDNYQTIKIKVPHYNVIAKENNPVLIRANNTTFTLDQIATKKTDKYTILGTAKVVKIVVSE